MRALVDKLLRGTLARADQLLQKHADTHLPSVESVVDMKGLELVTIETTRDGARHILETYPWHYTGANDRETRFRADLARALNTDST